MAINTAPITNLIALFVSIFITRLKTLSYDI
jgi:hypothetical protein